MTTPWTELCGSWRRWRIAIDGRAAFRSELVKKWGLAPPPYAYDRENHANARCLSPFFHKLSAKVSHLRICRSRGVGSVPGKW